MNDEDSDWISFDEAASYVEVAKGCYREKAIDLLRQAADGPKLKSRTITNSSPRWIKSVVAGNERFYSDGGQRNRTLPQGRTCALRIQINATEDRIRRNFRWYPPGD